MEPIKLFYSYSHHDEHYRQALGKHLSVLRRRNVVADWHDRRIGPGEEWQQQIDTQLELAQIILLLVSPDFIASEYCWSIEIQRAIQKHEARKATVIPIILRPVHLEGAPFMHLQALPRDAKPISQWQDPDEAWVDVVKGITLACEKARSKLAGTREAEVHHESDAKQNADKVQIKRNRVDFRDFMQILFYIGFYVAIIITISFVVYLAIIITRLSRL